MSRRNASLTRALERVGIEGTNYRWSANTSRLAASFIELQSRFLSKPELTVEERFAAGLCLTMAIVKLEDWAGIQTTGHLYQSIDGPTLAWETSDGHRDARRVSWPVMLTIDPGFDATIGGRLIEVLKTAIHKLDGRMGSKEDPVAEVLTMAQAWVFLEVTEHFGHVSGDLSMTALARSTHARLETQLALKSAQQPNADVDDSIGEAMAGHLESEGADESTQVLNEILQLTRLRDIARRSDAELCADLGVGFRGKIDTAACAGPLTSLLLAFALHITQARQHKPSTIVSYLRDGLPVVFTALKDMNWREAGSQELTEKLVAALKSIDGQKRRNAQALLGHFWRFARGWIDLPPLLTDRLPLDVAHRVDANVVWEHEADLMEKWLHEDSLDPNLTLQTYLVLGLLRATNLRISEILYLQIRNIRIFDNVDCVSIEVMRRGRVHGLKSESAQRNVEVSGKLATALAGQVIRRQQEDGGWSSHLLFGSKEDPKRVYRLGQMLAWLYRAVKAATGDPTSGCHHFRHASIDGRYRRMTLEDIRNGELEQLRADAGHSSLRSTQLSYLHSFASVLNQSLTVALVRHHRMTSQTAAAWTGQQPAALRQKKRRSQQQSETPSLGGSEWLWRHVERTAQSRRLPMASLGVELGPPVKPRPMSAPPVWTAVDILWMLRDIEQGATDAQAGRQRRLPQDVVAAALAMLSSAASDRLQGSGYSVDLVPDNIGSSIAALELRFGAASQSKYRDWLQVIAHAPDPIEINDEAWLAWLSASRGQYIRLDPAKRFDRWLTPLIASGLAPAKLRLVVAPTSPDRGLEVNRLIGSSLARAGVPSGELRREPSRPHRRRGPFVLLVGEEDLPLTNCNGASFSTAGLRAIMWAMRLAFIARRAAGVQS